MNWRKITNNPTDKDVSLMILQYLISIRETIKENDHLSFIKEKVFQKNVLDVGVVDHTSNRIASDQWKHKIIYDNSKRCLGVDIIEDKVDYLNSIGYNVKKIDATSNFDLKEKFDVVHVGHLIEHVDKPLDLLYFCSRHLNENGIILISTPNPFYFLFFWRLFFTKSPLSNFEHVCWITPIQALELGNRSGLVLTKYYIYKKTGRINFKKGKLKSIIHYLSRLQFLYIIINFLNIHENFTSEYIYQYEKLKNN